MKILLAVDGSSYTKKMLAYLTTHGELFTGDNEYTALTVQAPLPPRARAAVGTDVANSYHEEEAAKITGTVTRYLQRHGIAAKPLHKVGPAGETIAKAATAGKFELVVMGSHGHGALGNLVLGSVATKVLAQSEVPVLLVR